MVSESQRKALLIVLLLALLTSQSCEGATLIPPSPAVPTATIPPDLIASLQVVVTAIEINQLEMLRSLIGDEGVAPGGFAQGVDLKGHNNADEIVTAFDNALKWSNPICEGFITYMGALPDKAIIVYRGLEMDWSRFGFSDNEPNHAITLQLFNMPEGWRLVYITPFDLEWGLAHLGTLQSCPAVQTTP